MPFRPIGPRAPRRVWGGGRLRSAIRIGAPAGAVFGAIRFAEYGSLGDAIFAALFFGVFFGATMALISRKAWPGQGNLRSTDRAAVVRAVRRGEDIGEARLAWAVIEYCVVSRRTRERDRRYHWVLWLFAGLTLVIAVSDTFAGSVRSALVEWGLVAFWTTFLFWLPGRRTQLESNAGLAGELARHRMENPHSGGTADTPLGP